MTRYLSYPPAGSIVSIATHVIYRHKGVVSDRWWNGSPLVISGSARTGAVVEEPWDAFTQGQPVRVERCSTAISAAQVVNRARAFVGKPYQLFVWNCEHLVTAGCGHTPHSPQLAATLLIGAFVLLASAT